jgi:hypothetical protein
MNLIIQFNRFRKKTKDVMKDLERLGRCITYDLKFLKKDKINSGKAHLKYNLIMAITHLEKVGNY